MHFPTISFPPDPVVYITPSWAQLHQLAFVLSKQLLEQGKQFDRLVTLAKGGWPLSRSLVDFMSIPEVASVGVKFYQGINQRYPEPQVYQDIPVTVTGERVLLFDDVADSGESLQFTIEYLREKGVAEVTTATLFYKPQSVIRPDAYGAETSSWIIFPFETVETISALTKRWMADGVPKDQLASRFADLGFDSEQLTYFLQDS